VETTWTTSPSMTAGRLLKILALARAVLSMDPSETGQKLNKDMDTVLEHYGSVLPRTIGQAYMMPSFSYLAKYWQDPVQDVQQAARSIFRTTLSNLSTEARKDLVDQLSAVMSPNHKQGIRATLILAVMGMDDSILDLGTSSKVAQALVEIVDRAPLASRVSCVDVLGRGFSTWEAHLNGPQILRQLQSYANFLPVESEPMPVPLQSASRQAILRIATANTPLFVQFLSLDLMHAKSVEERRCTLKMLDVFINKKPQLLMPHLIKIVEAVIKCLDPNSPTTREALLPGVTATLHDMVRIYNSVVFHGPTQRLVCGSWEGPAIVFDLKTGGRWQVLEGFVKPVTAVAISTDGKCIVCATESELGLWQPTTNYLGIMMGVFSSSCKPTRVYKVKGCVRSVQFITSKSVRVYTDSNDVVLQL
jgi:hypothetical protein